ncbi:hypothetical protein sync_1520 [Synechococcus sp. CC9311]|nr:hypothetical protein sync_1520 [Synechococcus sp. CC9311]
MYYTRCQLMSLSFALEIRSSYSSDIQLWFPLSEAIPTFKVGLSLNESSADFRDKSGLELV